MEKAKKSPNILTLYIFSTHKLHLIYPPEVTELLGGKKYHHSFLLVVSSSSHLLPLTVQLNFPATPLTPKHSFKL